MAPAAAPDSSETQLRRAAALKSALRPVAPFLADPKVVEIMLNADGRIWVDRLGGGMAGTDARMGSAGAERMLRVIASEMGVELNAAAPLLVSDSRGPTARASIATRDAGLRNRRARLSDTLSCPPPRHFAPHRSVGS